MDEDDEFGDLYAGLGTSSAAEAPTTSAPSIPPPGTSSNAARFLDDDDDDDDDELYSGFASRRQDPPPRAPAPPDSIPRAQDFSEDLPENAPPGGAGDGSESDSDDDLQIVLNNDNKRKAAEVSEQESIPGEGNEDDEAPGTAPTPSWPEDQHQQQQQPQQQAGSFAEAQPLLPAPSPMGLPPGILPPGLLPPDQASRPGLPVAAPPPRPAGRPPFMHHAQYKYVRGPMVMGGPMMNSNPGVLGRGSFPPGWGPGKGPPPPGAGRPWGGPSHSEFHLPPTKSVFDMDLDGFDDKPWRHPNADISDYFNFGFNEVTWRMYCQQLSQLRLESTMQTKISVYESGRSEQPIGRAIQVEGGVGERRPSFDSRRNRNRDSNEVIEIVLREAEVENHFIGNDYDGTMYDLDEPSRGSLMGRNSSYSDADGHFFPMGPRPRGPPYRMFPGGPYPGRGGPRPPYYDPGHPMHMRPEGFGGDYGDSSRSRTKNSSQGRGAEDELSSGSVAVKDDRKHGDERRSKSSRDRDEDVNSDEHKRSHSEDDKSERRHRRRSGSHPRPEKDPKKEHVDADQSSRSEAEEPVAAAAAEAEEEEDHRRSRRRSSRDDEPLESGGGGGGDRQPKRAPSSSEKERGKDEEWSRKREDSSRRREDEYRRSRDEESSRKRDEESSRRREKPEEYSWKRDRDRDDPKRRSGYDEYEYDRRDREDDRERGKRHGYEKSSAAEDEDYLRRKSSSKHESSGRKDSSSYRYEDEYYEHRRSSRREPELQKDEEKKYYSSGRSKDSEKRNGSTSEYLDEKKRRKTGDYQKNAHAEKGLDEDSMRKGRKPGSKSEPGYREGSYSSDNDEDENRQRKGRSKMERLNRERPPQSKEVVEESLARLSSRHEIEGEKRSSSSAPEMRASKANGDRQEFLESVARRKERFMKMESSSKPSSVEREKEKLAAAQLDTSEFKHERPARKRRWGS